VSYITICLQCLLNSIFLRSESRQIPLERNDTVGSQYDTHNCLRQPHATRSPRQQVSFGAGIIFLILAHAVYKI